LNFRCILLYTGTRYSVTIVFCKYLNIYSKYDSYLSVLSAVHAHSYTESKFFLKNRLYISTCVGTQYPRGMIVCPSYEPLPPVAIAIITLLSTTRQFEQIKNKKKNPNRLRNDASSFTLRTNKTTKHDINIYAVVLLIVVVHVVQLREIISVFDEQSCKLSERKYSNTFSFIRNGILFVETKNPKPSSIAQRRFT